MDQKALLHKLIDRHSLTAHEAEDLFRSILAGNLSPVQIAGVAVALASKGETPDEIEGAVRAMRKNAIPIHVDPDGLLDTCGTGGDGMNTFNVSTAAALIAAAAGCRVAKHGNRAQSGTVGAADVLEELGINVDATPEQVARCIDQVGIGFLFAQTFHPAMRHAAPVRRELGVRTIFNLLGPLSSPAGARHQLLGVFSPRWLQPFAEVLRRLGSEHALVVHGEGGLDEISVSGPSEIIELKNGAIHRATISPHQFGLRTAPIDALRVHGRAQAAEALHAVISGQPSAHADIAVLNAGAAIYVAGRAAKISQGIEMARAVIESGAAEKVLNQLREESHR